ncbi:MAG: OmpA/MotB domain protein [Xanthobacteraceae bacterium]|nr:OmpA/MotB domain protein [Xanthobacteraceae bacterium]
MQRSGTAGPQSKVAPPPEAPAATRGSGATIQSFTGQRRETRDGNRTVIQEPGRTIIRDGDRTFIRRNENARFEINARNVRTERRGTDTVTVVERSDGTRIVTMTDTDGRLLRRLRRDRNNRDVVIIDNTYRGPPGRDRNNFFVNVPPPRISIPRERYIVEAQDADEAVIYETFMAPPLERIERGYSLDEVRYSPALRDRMRRVDVDTINFETGSWEVTPDGAARLKGVADAIMRAVQANPNEVFLVEGHTDAIGPDLDNLSLSDRRAEAVALVLTEQFGVPAENLTTQGYGEQYLKVNTQEAERTNRRVTVRRITPLLSGQNAAAAPPPR